MTLNQPGEYIPMRSTVPPTLTSAPENQLEGPFAFLPVVADNNSPSDNVGVRRGSETTAQEVVLHLYVANVALMRYNSGRTWQSSDQNLLKCNSVQHSFQNRNHFRGLNTLGKGVERICLWDVLVADLTKCPLSFQQAAH